LAGLIRLQASQNKKSYNILNSCDLRYYNTEMFRTLFGPGLGLVGPGLGLVALGIGLGLISSGLGLGLGLVGMVPFNITAFGLPAF
jgi:hypothetical protein